MDKLERIGNWTKLGAGLLAGSLTGGSFLGPILTYLLTERANEKSEERARELDAAIADACRQNSVSTQQLLASIQAHEDWLRFLYENYRAASHPDRVANLRIAIANILAGSLEPEWIQVTASAATTITPVEATVLRVADDLDCERVRHSRETGVPEHYLGTQSIRERLSCVDGPLVDAAILQLVGRGLIGMVTPESGTGIMLNIALTPLGKALSQMLRAPAGVPTAVNQPT